MLSASLRRPNSCAKSGSAEVAEKALVVGASQRCVVDHALGAGHEGGEAFEAANGGGSFAAGLGDPCDVEDDPPMDIKGSGGGEDPLGPEGCLAGAFEVQAGVALVALGHDRVISGLATCVE